MNREGVDTGFAPFLTPPTFQHIYTSSSCSNRKSSQAPTIYPSPLACCNAIKSKNAKRKRLHVRKRFLYDMVISCPTLPLPPT